MYKRFFKCSVFSFLLLFLFLPRVVFSQDVSFSYDSEARINRQLNNTVVDGYFIIINSKYPYIYFRDPNNKRINYGTYNFEKQHWIFYSNKLDPEKIDLKSLFLSVDLSKTELNRDRNGNPARRTGVEVANNTSPAKPSTTPGSKPSAPARPSTSTRTSTGTPPTPAEQRAAEEKNNPQAKDPWSNPSISPSERKVAYSGSGLTESRRTVLLNYVKGTPSASSTTVSRLATYLTQPCQNDYEKAFVIYCWIATNIAYDAEAFFANSIPLQNSIAVLRTRKGVCAGYSNLYKDLGSAMNIEVAVVSGHGKGFGYHQGLAIHQNHAWTGVKIGNEWILADATWGAGYISAYRVFEWMFNDAWFDVKPDQMVFSHLPTDLSYLLTSHLWSVDEYRGLPKLRPDNFSAVFTPEYVLAQKERYSPEDFIALIPMIPYYLDKGVSGEDFFRLSQIFTPEEMKSNRSTVSWTIQSGFTMDEYIAAVLADKSAPLVRLNSCPVVRGMGIKILKAPIQGELELGKTYTFEYSVENALDYALIDGRGAWYYVAPEGEANTRNRSLRDFVGTINSEGVVKITITCTATGRLGLVAKPEEGKGYYKILTYTVKDTGYHREDTRPRP